MQLPSPSTVAVLARYELRRGLGLTARTLLRRPKVQPLPSKVSRARQKRLLMRNGLAVQDGAPWWFYSALDRGDADPLTNYALRYVVENVPKSAQVLITGCGTGITAFYLADAGFEHVHGIDLLPECISVADQVQQLGGYTGTRFWVDDALRPTLHQSYDLITALHWVFSAWMGNYGNTPADAEKAFTPDLREALLTELLGQYAPHLRPGGRLLIELTDAVTDYRLPEDHPLGEFSRTIYPVRHTPEQVGRCAAVNGLVVEDQQLCVNYGHHPRTSYVLRKPA